MVTVHVANRSITESRECKEKDSSAHRVSVLISVCPSNRQVTCRWAVTATFQKNSYDTIRNDESPQFARF